MEELWGGLSGFVLGLGLSAAVGFRILLPFLGLSIAAMYGLIEPAPEFAWIGTWPALVALGTASVIEIGAYYIPWMDNLLDAVMTPLAVVAGTLATAAVMTDVPPFMKWSLALIAGGGMAGTIQAGTAILRGASTLTTGGAANALLATAELTGSAITTLLALFVPALALVVACVIALWAVRRRYKKSRVGGETGLTP